MRIDPALRALRGDPASQRRAQKHALAVRDAWQALPQVADMLGDLAAYGRGDCLKECEALDAAFEESAAISFVAGFFGTMAAAVRAQPLAQLPFRHSLSNGHVVIHLAQAGRATLALVVLEAGARPSPQTIAFADCERTETVVCGLAAGQIISRNARGALDFVSREFQAGDRVTYGAASSRLVRSVASDLVSLRLSRSPTAPLPSCEYNLADGSLVHQSAGSPDDSRQELMVTLLGAMGRSDAAPLLADLACGEGAEALRWQALRQGLALDSEIGFGAVSAVSNRPEDPLSQAASDLKLRLEHAYPALIKKAAT